MKVLFYATYPDQPIGYSKVAHVLANYLASFPNIDLVYMGVANYPALAVKHRPIDPRIRFLDVLAEETAKGSSEQYGVDLLEDILEREKPDVFFVYNDIIVTCRLFNELASYRQKHPLKVVTYLDLVYPFERAEFVRHVDRHTDLLFVFSDCWRQNLIQMGVSPKKLRVFPHGFNDTLFRHIPKEEARKQLGIPQDDFVFLNTNRNTYRKAQDITIGGFLHCLTLCNMDPRLKLFLNCSMKTPNGYDIADLIEVECMKRGIPVAEVQDRILSFPGGQGGQGGQVSDETINALYCATDVGLNSCTGEGFGLCSMEHAALGIPQIASAVGALPDIFAEGGALLIPPRAVLHTPRCLDEHTGEQGICSAEEFGDAMALLFRDQNLYTRHASWLREHMRQRYHWPTLLQRFRDDFNAFFAETAEN